MRVDNMVRNMRMVSAQAVTSSSGSGQTSQADNTPGVSKAVKANQARFDEASKGYVQASRTRDAVVTADQGLRQAREQVEKLKSGNLTDEQKASAAKSLKAALDKVDDGAKAQVATANDHQLANKKFDPKKIASVSADQLGKNVSEHYKSVEDLKKVDVTKASAAELDDLDQVLAKAQKQTSVQAIKAQAHVENQGNNVDKSQATLEALGAAPTQSAERKNSKTSDDLQAIRQVQALLKKAQTAPGGLFNTTA